MLPCANFIDLTEAEYAASLLRATSRKALWPRPWMKPYVRGPDVGGFKHPGGSDHLRAEPRDYTGFVHPLKAESVQHETLVSPYCGLSFLCLSNSGRYTQWVDALHNETALGDKAARLRAVLEAPEHWEQHLHTLRTYANDGDQALTTAMRRASSMIAPAHLVYSVECATMEVAILAQGWNMPAQRPRQTTHGRIQCGHQWATASSQSRRNQLVHRTTSVWTTGSRHLPRRGKRAAAHAAVTHKLQLCLTNRPTMRLSRPTHGPLR